jgi:hypothetical protein
VVQKIDDPISSEHTCVRSTRSLEQFDMEELGSSGLNQRRQVDREWYREVESRYRDPRFVVRERFFP